MSLGKNREKKRRRLVEEETDEAEAWGSDADDLSWRGYRYEGEGVAFGSGKRTVERRWRGIR